jgi:hypothetical protein
LGCKGTSSASLKGIKRSIWSSKNKINVEIMKILTDVFLKIKGNINRVVLLLFLLAA